MPPIRRIIGYSVVVVLLLPPGCGGGVAPPVEPQPSVDELLAFRAERVWGPEAYGAILDVAAEPSWMSEAVALPSVLRRDGRILMFFAGAEKTGNPYLSRVQIGLAESADGYRFHIANGGRPVLTSGPEGAFDSHSVSHPVVLQRTGDREAGPRTLWMYYVGADGTQGANDVRVERIGLARSEDGLHWRREARPVLDIGPKGSVDSSQAASPFVLQGGGLFHMWYGAYDGAHRIAYATSQDGLHWTKRGAVRGLRGAEAGELGPSVYFDGRRYLMFYNSVDPLAHEWKLYAAVSDEGLAWSAAHGGDPVVSDAPDWTFAAAGRGRNSAVHPSRLLPSPDGMLSYYAGEDKASILRIGLLRFNAR